ncbi:hypothetical protein MNBD_GAMMA12-3271 [hydrothermal vent metagenome]|uniref:Uncharacterized protein n=1 Tax=hydrothermal vent metagenome TaxID=652676 RepID=A0A3B0YL01_9ZZZZ
MHNKRKTIQLNRTAYSNNTIQVWIVSFVVITLFLYFITPLKPSAFVVLISIFSIIAASMAIAYFIYAAKINIELNSDIIYYEVTPSSSVNTHQHEKTKISYNDITSWRYSANNDEPFIQHGIDSIFTLTLKNNSFIELHITHQKILGETANSRDVLKMLFRWLPSKLQSIDSANPETMPSNSTQIFSILRGFFKFINLLLRIFRMR